jgi:hypothetical protein
MNREERRATRRSMRVPCDLNRKSTHRMRSHDGKKAKANASQPASVASAIAEKLGIKEEGHGS